MPALALRRDLRPLALWALAGAYALMGVVEAAALLGYQPLGADFLPVWTAGRLAWANPGLAYDAHAVTAAQAWLLPDLAWPRPFAYPPTALLVFAPLGLAPFWTVLAVWLAGGLAAIAFAAFRAAGRRRWLAVALCLVSPPTVLAALVGQTAPLVGALATFGVLGLERRPRLAGALIGLAAVLKPQALLVAPAALVAAGAFEALASAAVVGVALALAATAVFGPALWGAWLAGLPAFQAEIAAVPGMMAGVIAPAGLAHELGLTGAAALGLRLALGSAALALVWIAFRHKAPPTLKAAALLVGGLLVTPYAMHYDGSLLMPVAAARATDETVGLVPLIALLAAGALTTAHLGGAALVLFALLIAFQLRRAGEAPAA